MLKFIPAIGPRKYDNEKKQVKLGHSLFEPFLVYQSIDTMSLSLNLQLI